jgi:hypothetical protein
MKRIPGQRKTPLTYHSLALGYPIPGFLILGYPRAIPKTSKEIPLGYDQVLDIPEVFFEVFGGIQHLVISLA